MIEGERPPKNPYEASNEHNGDPDLSRLKDKFFGGVLDHPGSYEKIFDGYRVTTEMQEGTVKDGALYELSMVRPGSSHFKTAGTIDQRASHVFETTLQTDEEEKQVAITRFADGSAFRLGARIHLIHVEAEDHLQPLMKADEGLGEKYQQVASRTYVRWFDASDANQRRAHWE